jgi:hypothetical protein
MAGARSESIPSGYPTIGTKSKYAEYNLTRYPDALDSRDNNGNMKGFTNMVDYNMAEHINALTDAVMVMQRILGVGVEGTHADVKTRLNVLDNHNHDSRYGGAGWTVARGQTLIGHTHTGAAGHPSQINLVTEVQGKLNKNFLNLTSTGLTGADVMMSPTSSTKISDAVDDKLSVSQGGVIQRDLQVKGRLASRNLREWDINDTSNGTKVTDNTTLTNQAVRGSGTADVRFIHEGIRDLQYGKYVIGVRLKVNSKVSENVAYIRLYNSVGGNWSLNASQYIKGTDFDAAGKWQTFYLVGDVEGNTANSYPIVHIGKDATTASVNVDFDHAYIMPVTPAVFDM